MKCEVALKLYTAPLNVVFMILGTHSGSYFQLCKYSSYLPTWRNTIFSKKLLIDCRIYLEGSTYITRAFQLLPFIGIKMANLSTIDFAFVSDALCMFMHLSTVTHYCVVLVAVCSKDCLQGNIWIRYLCHFHLQCTITLFHRLSSGSFNGCDLHGHLLLLNIQTGIRNHKYSSDPDSVLIVKGGFAHLYLVKISWY